MLLRIDTKNFLTVAQAKKIESTIQYSIEDVKSCCFNETDEVFEIELILESSQEKVESVVDEIMKQSRELRIMKKKVLCNNIPDNSQEITCKVEGRIDLRPAKDFATKLYHLLDKHFASLAERCNAESRIYPSMIFEETLNRCNYITSFPQNLFLVSEFPHDYHVLKDISYNQRIEQHLKYSKKVLSPAVCFHSYSELENTVLEDNRTLTAIGNCFRHEVEWRVGGHRMEEFKMREIIFMGTQKHVENGRITLMSVVWELFNSLGLKGRIETATDPFYMPEDAVKGHYQMMANTKYELVVDTGKECFAIASFNNVQSSLCKAFNVQLKEGGYAHSGCVAFGLDRWVYALLSRHGLNEEAWENGILEQLYKIQTL